MITCTRSILYLPFSPPPSLSLSPHQVRRARDRVIVTCYPPLDALVAAPAGGAPGPVAGAVVKSVGGVNGASGDDYGLGDVAMVTR